MAKRQKAKRARKKVILFIVEGVSDRRALEGPLTELIEQSPDGGRFRILFSTGLTGQMDAGHFGGDLTTVNGASAEGMEAVLNRRCIAQSMDRHRYLPSDLYRIIMITDTDGAYIDDADVCQLAPEEDERKEHILYTPEGIRAANPEKIRERNAKKRETMDFLARDLYNSRLKVFKGENTSVTKPFSIYYFSCNLDHYLHGVQNMDGSRKFDAADRFSVECTDDPGLFARRIQDPAIAGMTYEESWDYIRQGRNSLQRHTNLGLLVDEIARGEL